ncbi:hypothetical protein F6U93_08005 [Tamlana haliotis]|uniref:Right handed beta helix domain-containing protein n=1 Tax=Pseudotamlana haliotis TaxID=2614804 RepID=A0A6N6MCY2_9FLAO|nr:right-handed parallel beta-helix repeat-containing protein [Tamlana haliotis]KAB1068071.1 hypothetical protein F6U93_08005 [Tamlana haliotis]
MKTYITLLLCFLPFLTVNATDFYCDPVHGKKSNDGSKEHPWGALETVFENVRTFKPGDVIFLRSGNHGHVTVIGENEKYITVKKFEDEKPIISSIVFGTDVNPASRWIFSNLLFEGKTKPNAVFIHQNSSRIRLLENRFEGQNHDSAIQVKGTQCRVESNVILNYKSGIGVEGDKNQIRNNRIQFFKSNAIEISGNYNVLEYNLLKECIAEENLSSCGIRFQDNETKGNIVRGNSIINFVKPDRTQIGLLYGIYGGNITISESIIENNLVVTNSDKGISIKGRINQVKIVNNTVVNPYFGLSFKNAANINTAAAIQVLGEQNSSNIIIRNNLSNDVLFQSIKGIADHNLTLPVSVHDYDLCFKNWAKFDFSLGENSMALNKGILDLAPKQDISLNYRTMGNFVNVGAFEYTKIDESNSVISVPTQPSDRQIHSKGKGDWDGQAQIRIGGVAEKIDGAGVFPFKLPLIPGGKAIISANFKIDLLKIDNTPEGGVDLYGLPSKSNFWVTDDMFYQGTFGQDIAARPIQNNYINTDTYGGGVQTSTIGQNALKNYINTLIESNNQPEQYLFLRLNPNVKDVSDFNRWNIVSANSEEKERVPMLELTVGYPELNKGTTQIKPSVKNLIVAASSPMQAGDVIFYFLGFEENIKVDMKLLNFSGEVVFKQEVMPSILTNHVFRTDNLNLPIGKYILEYNMGDKNAKQMLFVW